MPVDPQIQALLDKGAGVAATHTLPVAAARTQYESRIPLMGRPAPVAAVTERGIAGPGGDLRLRIYTPQGIGPFPLMVFFHGSGFVLCSLDTHDGMCRNLCAGGGCVVVSVDYRLAPEAKFPAATDDCLAATRWAAAHASELNADPGRIVVAGDSAGGNLAAVTALRIRDEGGPASYAENAEGFSLTRATMEWFWDHYLEDPAQAAHPHASPLRAPDLAGLPPAFVMSAEYDPLRDEAERYGERLREADVAAEIVRVPGMNHGFLFWVGVVDAAAPPMAQAGDWLRGVFAQR
jgi:acetyl esterase